MVKIVNALLVSAALAVSGISMSAAADDANYQAAMKDIEQTLGFVPDFFKPLPKAGFAGAWQQLKELEFGGDTALDAKTKILIELAVVSQIPCEYCIWADTAAARAAGATDQEIGEAVAVAATGRYWSTILNGLQVDLTTFKSDFNRLLGAETAK